MYTYNVYDLLLISNILSFKILFNYQLSSQSITSYYPDRLVYQRLPNIGLY